MPDRAMLRWLAPLVMILGVLLAILLKERAVRTEVPGRGKLTLLPFMSEAWEQRQRLDVEGYPPKAFQLRYEHNMVGMRRSEFVMAYPTEDAQGTPSDTAAMTSIHHNSHGQWLGGPGLRTTLRSTDPAVTELLQASVAVTSHAINYADSIVWVACTELSATGSTVRLFQGGSDLPLEEAGTRFAGRNPMLLADATTPRRLWLLLINDNDVLEAWDLNAELAAAPAPSRALLGTVTPAQSWRAYQPPHAVVSPDGQSVLVALKAEFEAPTYTDEEGQSVPIPAAGNVESEVWIYALRDGVSLSGDAGSQVGARLQYGYHERPMLATDPTRAAYCVIGTWTENPTDDVLAQRAIGSETRLLRKYTLDVLRSTDGNDWSLVTRPLPEQREVASAQPHLAAYEDHLRLLYAWDANLLEVAHAHRLLLVASDDAGEHWGQPTGLTGTDLTTGVREEPLDIRIIVQPWDATREVRVTWREVIPAALGTDSIAVGEPAVRLWTTAWSLGGE